MAQSSGGMGSLISLAAVGGLAWWAYEHFFAGPAAVTPPAPAPVGGRSGAPVILPPPSPPSPGPCAGAGVLALILGAVQADKGATYGENLPGTLTVDEWDFYGNRICTGLMDQFGVNADTLFPGAADRGGPLNWNAFAGYAREHGLSAGLIPVDPSVHILPFPLPSVPFPGRGHAYGRLRRPQVVGGSQRPQLIGTHLARPWRVA
jgi:hypothetical protein